MRYLVFGASTVQGEKDHEYGGWAGRLKKYLEIREGHSYFYNLAISGNTSADILRRIEAESRERIRNKPKEEWTVILSLGTNDSLILDGQPRTSKNEFEKNVQQIFDIAQDLVDQVVVIGVQPVIEENYNKNDRGKILLNERIREYDDIVNNLAEQNNIEYIGTFSKLIQLDNVADYYDEDGVHPNAKGHKIIFDEVVKFI